MPRGKRLTGAQKKTIWKRRVDNMPVKEIAQTMGLSYYTVKHYIEREERRLAAEAEPPKPDEPKPDPTPEAKPDGAKVYHWEITETPLHITYREPIEDATAEFGGEASAAREAKVAEALSSSDEAIRNLHQKVNRLTLERNKYKRMAEELALLVYEKSEMRPVQ